MHILMPIHFRHHFVDNYVLVAETSEVQHKTRGVEGITRSQRVTHNIIY